MYVISSAAAYNKGGRDRMIGFRMSPDEIRSRNQCNMEKRDRNFLLYDRSIMKCRQGCVLQQLTKPVYEYLKNFNFAMFSSKAYLANRKNFL
jgi:hypothetical protein